MTARTRRGYKGHETHGADHGTPHQRLMKQHTQGFRAGGAPHAKEASISGPKIPPVLAASQGAGAIPPEMSAAAGPGMSADGGGTAPPMAMAAPMGGDDEEDGQS